MNKKNPSSLLKNKRASWDYEIVETLVCGMVLQGWEVKSLRHRMANFKSSWVKINEGQVSLQGLKITPWKNAENSIARGGHDLLLKKNEIKRLVRLIQEKKYAIIPLEIFAGKKYLKCSIGLGKGRKKYDKKQKLKERAQEREIRQKIGRF
jgi:SsrA-binding protein